jgi:hypothetical protein
MTRQAQDQLDASKGRPSVTATFESAQREHRQLGHLAPDAYASNLRTNAMSSVEEFYAEVFAMLYSPLKDYRDRLDQYLTRHGGSAGMFTR